MPIDVKVVDRESLLFDGPAEHVAVPSVSGSIGILPGHQPLLAVLTEGKIRVNRKMDAEAEVIEVSGGFVSFDQDSLTAVVKRDLISKVEQ